MPLSMALSRVIQSAGVSVPCSLHQRSASHTSAHTEKEKMRGGERESEGTHTLLKHTHTLPRVFFLAVTDDRARFWL